MFLFSADDIRPIPPSKEQVILSILNYYITIALQKMAVTSGQNGVHFQKGRTETSMRMTKTQKRVLELKIEYLLRLQK
jgi:hypothetical protein